MTKPGPYHKSFIIEIVVATCSDCPFGADLDIQDRRICTYKNGEELSWEEWSDGPLPDWCPKLEELNEPRKQSL